MKLSHRVENNICITTIEGKFTGSEVRQLSPYINTILIENQHLKALVLNFNQTTDIDSAGVGAIIITSKILAKKEMKSVLCQLGNKMRGTFEVANLDKIFPIFDTEEAALVFLNQENS